MRSAPPDPLNELVLMIDCCVADPAAYSFAHGGKDGHPYHVHRALYDANIERLRQAVQSAKIGHTTKAEALRSLAGFVERVASPAAER